MKEKVGYMGIKTFSGSKEGVVHSELAHFLMHGQIFAALLAAAVHDVGHPGLTNQFLMATQSPLATLYNDQSVLENHHAATAFKIMQQPHCDILKLLPPQDRMTVRSMIIQMVLGTDMAKHFKFLADCRSLVMVRRHAGAESTSEGLSHLPIDLTDAPYEDHILLLCNIVHCADLSASTKPWALCFEWSNRIMNEFFNQV